MRVKLQIAMDRGGEFHPAGSEVDLNEAEREALAGLFEPAPAPKHKPKPKPPAPPKGDEREAKLLAAMAELDPGENDTPTVAALKKAAAIRDIRAADRDRVLAAHRAAAAAAAGQSTGAEKPDGAENPPADEG